MSRLSNEFIGIIGTVFILISLTIPSTHRKQNICMRILNNIGNVFLIVYGLHIGSLSTIILNIIVFGVNTFYVVKLIISLAKKKHMCNNCNNYVNVGYDGEKKCLKNNECKKN